MNKKGPGKWLGDQGLKEGYIRDVFILASHY